MYASLPPLPLGGLHIVSPKAHIKKKRWLGPPDAPPIAACVPAPSQAQSVKKYRKTSYNQQKSTGRLHTISKKVQEDFMGPSEFFPTHVCASTHSLAYIIGLIILKLE